jgi:filamentous hemagglutinin family protein
MPIVFMARALASKLVTTQCAKELFPESAAYRTPSRYAYLSSIGQSPYPRPPRWLCAVSALLNRILIAPHASHEAVGRQGTFMGRNSLPWRPSRAHLLGSVFPPLSHELLSIVAAASLAMAASPAIAGSVLPTGGSVAAGSANIDAPTSNSLTVSQSSQRAIINWGSFSIGAGGTVLFNNGSGATLNRVTGGNLSQIDGSLKATGSVYLINPQGIVIGPSGQVIANGSFIASTRDVDNNAFMSGQSFSASGTSNGSIINQGVITSNNGDAILVGSSVTNTGTISAPNGTVGLAAGNEVTLQPAGSDSRIAISGGTGSVTNSGDLKAAQAELNAAGGNVYALVENNGGAISATGTTNVNGHVWLTAGGTGTVTIAGNVTAQNTNGSGGAVTVRGANIALPGTINASATSTNGAGGNVSVVAANSTSVTGSISARGGASGAGGTVETSGNALAIGGAKIDAGQGGQWLLDPYDLTVDSTAASTIDSTLGAGTSVTLKTTATGTSGPGNVNAAGNGDIFIDSAINWGTSATLTLDAYHSIFVNAPITITAAGGIVLKTNDGGTGGDYSFGPRSDINYGSTNHGGTLTVNGTSYTLLYSMSGVQNINGSSTALGGDYALATSLDATSVTNWIPIGTNGAGVVSNSGNGFAGVFDGLGNTISNLVINLPTANYVGLFGYSSGTIRDVGLVGGSTNTETGGGQFYVGGLVGYQQGGEIEGSYETGPVFASAYVGGLVGYSNGAAIETSFATGLLSANSLAGGLVGYQNGGSISASYATGGVSNGENYAGGLVGYKTSGTITNSYAAGRVDGGYVTGGLVGYQASGTIMNSYATGSVETIATAGGLVGENSGTINTSYATGSVDSNKGDAGGLAGYNNGAITNSYSVGNVIIPYASGGTVYGGLVGQNHNGTITGSYWDTQSSGQTVGISLDNNDQSGNVTGLTTTEMMTASNLGALTFGTTGGASGWVIVDADGTLNNAGGAAGGTYPMLLSEYSTTIASPHQLQLMALDLSAAYTLAGNFSASDTAGGDVWSSEGFVPIGSNATPFTGSLNGENNAIASLTINNPSGNFIGLFGDIGSSGTVENLNLTNVSITGSTDVGGIAGLTAGIVTNSTTSGSVTGSSDAAGGLVGYNDGTISHASSSAAVSGGTYIGGLVGENVVASTITDSFATGTANGITGIGGLVGDNSGTIADSYASGAVGDTTDAAGGLIGEQAGGSVTDIYALGAVTGARGGVGAAYNYLGGLIGLATGGLVQSGYASGTVSAAAGNLAPGGVVGRDTAATFANVYWDEGTTGQSLPYSPAGGFTGTATAVGGTSGLSAFAQSSYGSLSIGHWLFVAGARPMLAIEYSTTITNAHQLQLAATNPYANYTLANNIDLAVTEGGGDVWSLAGFVPIYLSGSFNGQGFLISNLYEDNPSSTTGMGLFDQIRAGATVQDLQLYFLHVTGNNDVGALAGSNYGLIQNVEIGFNGSESAGAITGNNYVGGLVGANLAGGQIGGSASTTNIRLGDTVTGNVLTKNLSVSGTTGVGGLAGWNAGTIEGGGGSSFDTTVDVVSGGSDVGGLVGWNTGSIDSGLAYVRTVAGSGYGVGGLVGYSAASGSITNSEALNANLDASFGGAGPNGIVDGAGGAMGGLVGYNMGVIGTAEVSHLTVGISTTVTSGGFVGENGGSISSGTDLNATVNGTSYVGGFAGYDIGSGSITTSSDSSVTVSGVNEIGGFAGAVAASATVSGSSSTGTVTATGNRVGGFVGWNAGSLSDDSAAVAVHGASEVGGLVGWNDGGVAQSAATGNVTTSGSGGGGLVGYNTSTATIDQSFATGTIGGLGGDLGGLVGSNLGSISNAYATGNVGQASTVTAGGLVGVNNGSISDVYATGVVLGRAHDTGALVGANTATGDIQDAYYVSTVNGALPAAGQNAGTLSATAMGGTGQPSPTSQATYVGFNFSTVWTIATGHLPTLQDAP